MFDVCYCMSALLLFLYIFGHSSSIPLDVFFSYSQTESRKGQIASRSHPLFRGEISGKRPPSPSLVGVCLCFRDIPERGYYTGTQACCIKKILNNKTLQQPEDQFSYIGFFPGTICPEITVSLCLCVHELVLDLDWWRSVMCFASILT